MRGGERDEVEEVGGLEPLAALCVGAVTSAAVALLEEREQFSPLIPRQAA